MSNGNEEVFDLSGLDLESASLYSPSGTGVKLPPTTPTTAFSSMALESSNPPSPQYDCVSADVTHAESMMHTTELVEIDKISKIYVDESRGPLDKAFVQTLVKKSAFTVVLRETEAEPGTGPWEAGSFCQAGFVENHDGVVRMVTTKHSFGDREIEGEVCSVFKLQISIPGSKFYAGLDPSTFPEAEAKSTPLDIRDGEVWRHGNDMAWGPEYKSFFEAMGPIAKKRLDGLGSYKMVRKDFEIREGLIVGMIVYNRYGVDKSSPAFTKSDFKGDKDLSQEKVNKIFGPKESVVIPTGRITFSTPKHLEHNLNTAKGFHGVMLFILDVPGQLDSVTAEDHGKVIAVHGGYIYLTMRFLLAPLLFLCVALIFWPDSSTAELATEVGVDSDGEQQIVDDNKNESDILKKIFDAIKPPDDHPLFDIFSPKERKDKTDDTDIIAEEEAQSIWDYLRPTTSEDDSKARDKAPEDSLDMWEHVLLKAREYQAVQRGSDPTSLKEKIDVIAAAIQKASDQMNRTFDGLDLKKFDLVGAWYASQREEQNKDPIWKRQQHRFLDPLKEEQALALADAMYLNGVAYADTCDEIEDYLTLFRNNSFVLVNCTTESKPGEPAHYIVVRKQPPEEQESSWFKKSESKLEVTFVVRATKDLMDMLTDALLEASPFHGGLTHHGIGQAAMWLFDLYKDWLPQLLNASQSDKMTISTVGYSLGAGAAALLSMEFNENFPDNIESRSVGFGTPAVLTRELSESVKSTITTLVNDADCVSRMSGPTLYNAFVRGSNYNWTLDALRDFDQFVPFLRQNLPFGDSLLSNDTVADIRKDLTGSLLEKFNKVLDTSLPTALESGVKLKEVQLYPPGTCIHLFRDGTSWQSNFVPCTSFDELELVSRMLDDHLLDTGYYPGLLTYIR
ncbi:MAG: hypothetical protein SGILL_008531, partial [Bacillariaceae sp.]